MPSLLLLVWRHQNATNLVAISTSTQTLDWRVTLFEWEYFGTIVAYDIKQLRPESKNDII